MCNGGDGRASIIHYAASEVVLSERKKMTRGQKVEEMGSG